MKNLLALLLLLAFFTSNAQEDGDDLFDDGFLHEIRFTTVDTNFFIATKEYQQVDLELDGNALDGVGFKRKGNISAYPTTNKYGIKIKTNKYVDGQEYDGIKEFTLHINYQDPSLMREKLTYDICDEMGLFSLRTSFAKVYINDIYWGLYTLVEGKDEMYKQVFDNRDMDAIESLDFGNMCYISDNPDDYNYEAPGTDWPYYILENGDPLTAWPSFANMIDVLNNTPTADFMSVASNYLNVKDFFTYQAVNVYLLNFDSYISFRGNQIYVYDETANKWQVTPWDFNASFGLWETSETADAYPMIPDVISSGCIASKMTEITALEDHYLTAMCLLNNTVADTMTLFAKIDGWYDQIKAAVYEDSRKVITNAQFDNGVGEGYQSLFGENIPGLKTFIRDRQLFIKQELTNAGFDCEALGLGINDPVNDQPIILYPNPANNWISLKGIENVSEITLYNSQGQIVLNSTNVQEKVDIGSLENGFYFVRITDQNAMSSTIQLQILR
ncbi:MAG: CotH kinase family protein [Flavobacteriales bacterium]|nr:CotH kinase family protein [Flavobacteriales bacterium]